MLNSFGPRRQTIAAEVSCTPTQKNQAAFSSRSNVATVLGCIVSSLRRWAGCKRHIGLDAPLIPLQPSRPDDRTMAILSLFEFDARALLRYRVFIQLGAECPGSLALLSRNTKRT
jgi:hypothetical protein